MSEYVNKLTLKNQIIQGIETLVTAAYNHEQEADRVPALLKELEVTRAARDAWATEAHAWREGKLNRGKCPCQSDCSCQCQPQDEVDRLRREKEVLQAELKTAQASREAQIRCAENDRSSYFRKVDELERKLLKQAEPCEKCYRLDEWKKSHERITRELADANAKLNAMRNLLQ